MTLHGTSPAVDTAIVTSAPVVDTVIVAKPVAMNDAQLIEALNASHAACNAATTTALAKAIETGELLIEAKSRCKHGEWGSWLDANFSGSARSAQTYMRVARRRDSIEAKTAETAVLTLDAAVEAVAEPRATVGESVALDDWVAKCNEIITKPDVTVEDLIPILRQAGVVTKTASHVRRHGPVEEFDDIPLSNSERSELEKCESVIGEFLSRNEGVHECLTCIPEFSGEGFDALVEDIREHGQLDPVVYWRGLLVDGRARLRACRILGIEPKTRSLEDGDDPWGFCWSANVLRASYSPSQRAAATARLAQLAAEVSQ